MKNSTAYKRWTVFIVVVVMSFDIFTGLRPLCANRVVPLLRALGIELVRIAPSVQDDPREQIYGVELSTDDRGGSSKCCCKKQKKCPAIPRAALTSNPTHRLNEFQRQAQSVCSDSLMRQTPKHPLVVRGDTALLSSDCRASSCSFSPLELTCILLI